MTTPSNLQRSSSRQIHQFEFSNTIDDPIEVEEMEDPSDSINEQESTFGEEASSEEDSKAISCASGSKTEK